MPIKSAEQKSYRDLDTYYLSPFKERIRHLIFEERFSELEDYLKSLPQQDVAHFFQWSIIDDIDPTAWIAAFPTSFYAWNAQGLYLHRKAWVLRGTGTFDTIPKKVIPEIFHLTAEAKKAFSMSASLNPMSALPLTGIISTTDLDGISWEEAGYVLQKAQRLKPHDYESARIYMMYAAERWFGSHAECLTFARSLKGAPKGSNQHGLIVMAHIQTYFYYVAFEKSPEQAEMYLRQASVQYEIENAANMSVLNPEHKESLSSIEVLNNLAFAFYIGDNNVMLGKVLSKLNGRFSMSPWYMLGAKTEKIPAELSYRFAPAAQNVAAPTTVYSSVGNRSDGEEAVFVETPSIWRQTRRWLSIAFISMFIISTFIRAFIIQ